MKTKTFFLILVSLLLQHSAFSQKSHCRTLSKNAIIENKIGMISKRPYDNNRPQLIFNKKTIHHQCNPNDYQTIVLENFDSTLESTIFQIWTEGTTAHQPNTDSKNLPLVYRDSQVVIKNGLAHLQVDDHLIEYTYDSTTQTGYPAGRLETKKTDVFFNNHWEVEDMGCYKYGRFSTRLKYPKTDKVNFAFWLWGGGNEIDVFEYFNRTDCQIRSSVHQWNIFAPDGITHAEFGLDYELGDLSEKFHIWELEWTPYKIVWRLDGKTFRTFYRYYKMKITHEDSEKKVCLIGLDCNEIPEGEAVVWELEAWYSFSSRPIDIIIGLGLLKPINSELLIDWVKIEQRPNMQLAVSDLTPCVGEEVIISASNTDQIVDWKVSDNL
ncbi:MAG TPA: glycosyl hydrolase family protein, partial [Phaeodactylibacter sp.]|nr:glycosyl hydrolase family protein [Phaeodactylibacter sp.]